MIAELSGGVGHDRGGAHSLLRLYARDGSILSPFYGVSRRTGSLIPSIFSPGASVVGGVVGCRCPMQTTWRRRRRCQLVGVGLWVKAATGSTGTTSSLRRHHRYHHCHLRLLRHKSRMIPARTRSGSSWSRRYQNRCRGCLSPVLHSSRYQRANALISAG